MTALPAAVRTRGAAVGWCERFLLGHSLHYGHGTANAADEAFALVIGVTGYPGSEAWNDAVLSGTERERIGGLAARRVSELCPLPYLLGEAWFAGLRFACDRRALVPRSPLGEIILAGFEPWYVGPPPSLALDLCCGGGAIGIACAVHHPDLRVVISDIDSDALQLAKENVRLHAVEHRVEVCHSDLFDGVSTRGFDLVLSNPPYVDSSDLATMPAEYRHEPVLGLAAGDDGLAFAQRILAGARGMLAPHGLLLLEVGNSWEALEDAYPRVPFLWIELDHGGHGVLAITAEELDRHAAEFRPV